MIVGKIVCKVSRTCMEKCCIVLFTVGAQSGKAQTKRVPRVSAVMQQQRE